MNQWKKVAPYLKSIIEIPESELNFSNPWELLVAVVLSAQCTDKRINMVTPALFAAYPTPLSMSSATADDIFPFIASVTYPRAKAEHLAQAARLIVEKFDGQVPSDHEKLMTLPGVGRKTANVVSAIAFRKPYIAVDTHVFRVSHRLGLSNGTTPLAVEQDLNKLIPLAERPDAHHYLLLFGRYFCKAQRPQCEHCGLRDLCLNR